MRSTSLASVTSDPHEDGPRQGKALASRLYSRCPIARLSKIGVVAEIFRWKAPKFLRGVFLKVH